MTPLQSIKEEILNEIKGPVPVRVDKSYIKISGGGYCFDGTVLRPETLEATDEILKEVPLNPIWAGKNGQGIFCPPGKDQVAIVSFLSFNRSFPFYSGIWSDAYTPSAGADGSFVLTDGKGGIFQLSGDGLFSLLNNNKSLKLILEEIVEGFITLQAVGSAGPYVLSPDQIITMTALKAEIALLFKE